MHDSPVDDWAQRVGCNNITKIEVSKLLLVTGRIEVVNNYQGNDPICRSLCAELKVSVPTRLDC